MQANRIKEVMQRQNDPENEAEITQKIKPKIFDYWLKKVIRKCFPGNVGARNCHCPNTINTTDMVLDKGDPMHGCINGSFKGMEFFSLILANRESSISYYIMDTHTLVIPLFIFKKKKLIVTDLVSAINCVIFYFTYRR